MNEESKYKTFGIPYKKETEGIAAEFALFNAIKPYIKTHKKEDGTFVKTLTADFPEVKAKEIKVFLPDEPKLMM